MNTTKTPESISTSGYSERYLCIEYIHSYLFTKKNVNVRRRWQGKYWLRVLPSYLSLGLTNVIGTARACVPKNTNDDKYADLK